MSTPYALVPVKSHSERCPDKNLRPFHEELSLTEIKIRTLLKAGFKVIVSSNDDRAMHLAEQFDVQFQRRPDELCQDKVVLGDLFKFCLAGLEEQIVYWAHVTSPFVSIRSMQGALDLVGREHCVLGVKIQQHFLWGNLLEPINYDPYKQPRSQDLPEDYHVTGGIHMAYGKDFINARAVSFAPAEFVFLNAIESVDINTRDDWELAQAIAPKVLESLLD